MLALPILGKIFLKQVLYLLEHFFSYTHFIQEIISICSQSQNGHSFIILTYSEKLTEVVFPSDSLLLAAITQHDLRTLLNFCSVIWTTSWLDHVSDALLIWLFINYHLNLCLCKILKNTSFYPSAFIYKQVFFVSLSNAKFINQKNRLCMLSGTSCTLKTLNSWTQWSEKWLQLG